MAEWRGTSSGGLNDGQGVVVDGRDVCICICLVGGKAWSSPESSGVHQEARSAMEKSTGVEEASPGIECWVCLCQVTGWKLM